MNQKPSQNNYENLELDDLYYQQVDDLYYQQVVAPAQKAPIAQAPIAPKAPTGVGSSYGVDQNFFDKTSTVPKEASDLIKFSAPVSAPVASVPVASVPVSSVPVSAPVALQSVDLNINSGRFGSFQANPANAQMLEEAKQRKIEQEDLVIKRVVTNKKDRELLNKCNNLPLSIQEYTNYMYVGNQFNNIKLVELLQKYKAEECIEKCKERCEQNLFNIIVAACSAVILSMTSGKSWQALSNDEKRNRIEILFDENKTEFKTYREQIKDIFKKKELFARENVNVNEDRVKEYLLINYYNIMDQKTTTVQYKFADKLADWPKLPILPPTPGGLPLMEPPTVIVKTQQPKTGLSKFLKTFTLK